MCMRLIAKRVPAKSYLENSIDLQIRESNLSIENLVSANNDKVVDVYVVYRVDIYQIHRGQVGEEFFTRNVHRTPKTALWNEIPRVLQIIQSLDSTLVDNNLLEKKRALLRDCGVKSVQ